MRFSFGVLAQILETGRQIVSKIDRMGSQPKGGSKTLLRFRGALERAQQHAAIVPSIGVTGIKTQARFKGGQRRCVLTVLPFEQAVQMVPFSGSLAGRGGLVEKNRRGLELSSPHEARGLSQEIRRGWGR